jgi:hypothetical protein
MEERFASAANEQAPSPPFRTALIPLEQWARRQPSGAPSFWEELVEAKGLRGAWVDDFDLHGAPELMQRLAREGLWLEQEPIAVDPRTPAALEAML